MTGFRVLQLLPGIGPGTAGKLLDRFAGRSPFQLLSSFPPPARAAEDWPALTLLMQRLWTKTAEWPAEIDLRAHGISRISNRNLPMLLSAPVISISSPKSLKAMGHVRSF